MHDSLKCFCRQPEDELWKFNDFLIFIKVNITFSIKIIIFSEYYKDEIYHHCGIN